MDEFHRSSPLVIFNFKLDDLYKKLKNTYDTKEWPSVYSKIIFLLENQKKTHKDVYNRILIEEEEKQKILEYVKGRPSSVERFYKHLIPELKDEPKALREIHEIRLAQFEETKYLTFKERCRLMDSQGKEIAEKYGLKVVHEV